LRWSSSSEHQQECNNEGKNLFHAFSIHPTVGIPTQRKAIPCINAKQSTATLSPVCCWEW
jgi:hypothetical protein